MPTPIQLGPAKDFIFHDRSANADIHVIGYDNNGDMPEAICSYYDENGTYFGCIIGDNIELSCLPVPQAPATFKLVMANHTFFRVPKGLNLCGKGQAMIVLKKNYTGITTIGGPIEETGRLKYIDGCTDTLLISPLKKGDPCLNALYFPPNTRQTLHTHPSLRAGMVISGSGFCISYLDNTVISNRLHPGQLFVIPADCLHAFQTTTESLIIIAFHPDSDTGPTDIDHPMINRTIVDGISAAQLIEIQTQ
jgi:quercetin dioxygenase-like cupin family protein